MTPSADIVDVDCPLWVVIILFRWINMLWVVLHLREFGLPRRVVTDLKTLHENIKSLSWSKYFLRIELRLFL